MGNKEINIESRSKTRTFLYCVVLVLAVIIQYRQTLDYGFVWDDKIVIQENPRVKQGMRAIPELFTKFKSPYRHDQYGYRPITLVSFALEVELWGGNPYYHHLMNLFYYTLLCLLIIYFLLKFFKNYHSVFSFLIALIYTVHPLHVEVVANIKSRDEILAMIFVVLSLITYVKFLRDNKISNMVATVIFYFLAFLSKENSITSLLIYPLIFVFENRNDWHRRIKSMIISNLHIVLLMIASVIIFQLAESSEIGKNEMIERNIVKEDDILGNSLFHTDGLLNKIPTVLLILLMYFKLFFIPYPLVFYYGYNQVPVRGWMDVWVLISMVFFIGLFYLLYRYRKTHPELLFGGIFFIFSISIYLHIIRKLSDTMADRFMFMPSLGLAIMLVGFIGLILKIKWYQLYDNKTSKTLSNHRGKAYKIVVGLTLAIAMIYTIISYQRTGVWKDDKTLVFSDMKYLENCSRVHYYYANILWNDIKRNPKLKPKLEKEMIYHYRRSVEIAPEYVYYARMELATYYTNEGRHQEALDLFSETNRLFPDRGPVLINMAQNMVNLGRYKEARPILIRAGELAPYYSAVPLFLIIVDSKLGNFEQAIQTANKAMKDFPNEVRIFKDALSTVYADMKDKDRFIQNTLELLSYGGNSRAVYTRIIQQLEQWGMKEEAEFYRAEARKKGLAL